MSQVIFPVSQQNQSVIRQTEMQQLQEISKMQYNSLYNKAESLLFAAEVGLKDMIFCWENNSSELEFE